MGRGKLIMNIIPNQKTRISTFKKRKNSLMKKAYELSTLCDVQTCVLVHGPASEDSSQSDLEFHSWPSNRTHLEPMIRAYKATSSSCNCKCFDLTHFFSDRKKKIESETCKLREKFICPKWDQRLDCLSEHQLGLFMETLDAKIDAATGMIAFMEADYGNLFSELLSENTVQTEGDFNLEDTVQAEEDFNLEDTVQAEGDFNLEDTVQAEGDLNPSTDELDLPDLLTIPSADGLVDFPELFTVPSADELVDLHELFTIPSADELVDFPDFFTIPSADDELGLPNLFTIGVNTNEEVIMDEFDNIRYLQMVLGAEEEDLW